MNDTVGESGEAHVLQRILARLSGARASAAVLGPGDDCAVLRTSAHTVVSSDTMIEGADFRRDWHSGYELGWKLGATNLSDVAAMGAVPTALTVSLAVPRDTPVQLLEDIASGVTAACESLAPGCGVVGGDLATAPVLVAAVTALGDAVSESWVTRSGGRPGDVVYYAGDLGLSGIALARLFALDSGADAVSPAALEALRCEIPAAMRAHLTPMPPIAAAIAAGGAGATAMMDVSDSLSLDAARLAAASGVKIVCDPRLLTEAFGEQHGEAVSVTQMLTGGEDHGFLASFAPGAQVPSAFRRIGVMCEHSGDAVQPRLFMGDVPYAPQGWDPYR